MSDSDDRYPISEYPYYRIKNWSKHQPPEARQERGSKFIRNWTNLLQDPRYFMLTLTERGMLHGLWLYKGGTGLNPPRDPTELTLSLKQVHTKHTVNQLKNLERRGFIVPDHYKRRVEERRRDKSPPPLTETKTPEAIPEPDRCESEHPWDALSDKEKEWQVQDILMVHAGPAFSRMKPEIRLRTATAAAKARIVARGRRP